MKKSRIRIWCLGKRIVVVFVLLIVCTSCSFVKVDRLHSLVIMTEGVLAWSAQDWPSAISAFLSTNEKAKSIDDIELSSYATYALASTYVAQLEEASAFERLNELSDDLPSDLLSGVWYQKGILAFRASSFAEASLYFKKSLEIDSSSIDAKINLELSNRSQKMNSPTGTNAPRPLSDEKRSQQDFESIFDVVRKKEQDIWKNMENSQQESSYYDH